ncbi:MAG TPA: bifunctional glutamate N-acetyltransferase/amino-acid acetyltransferase ArgJ [Candidatus Onthomonas avicola]|nr:bifunctional glutamate N-acetyltransferase/amino-acid acetyltransferase ArgJ [Candidatus Onthomonas avicola]
MREISGGVVAAKGFRAAGIRAGVKATELPLGTGAQGGKKDLAMILSDVPCAVAGMFTTNQVKAAPIYVTMGHIAGGSCRGIIANSGNANACAPNSRLHAVEMCAAAAEETGLIPEDFAVASTGVIGQELNIAAILQAMPELVSRLSGEPYASDDAAHAIMTTDTREKTIAYEVEIGGKTVRVGGIAKGSGMIHPNMGTMLSFVTTDAAITPHMLSQMVHEVVPRTFNRVTVDGDTSTNDTFLVLANGMADNALIDWAGEDYRCLRSALMAVCTDLARKMAGDGEGATRLVTCTVRGASDEAKAERLARAVVGSSLVKAAMFGADANWGRVLCAMGYSGAPFDPEQVDVTFRSSAGAVEVCQSGSALPFDEALAKAVLSQEEVVIDIALREGAGEATCWGCDLTYDYVKINGDYRS